MIYRYLTVERAIKAIKGNYLWFSSPNSFNDPLDMYIGLIDFSVNKHQAKEFADRRRSNQGRSIKRALARDVIKRKEELQRYQRKNFNDTKVKSGVCCFSKKSVDLLM